MKAGLLCLAGLSAVAVAQPHRRHQHKRAVTYDVVTDIDVVTATAPAAVVYVNDEGVPTSTSWPAGAATSASSSSEEKAATKEHSPEPYHTHASSSSSSVYVAPTTHAAPSTSSSVYVAPTPKSTSSSVYIAPTTYAASSSSEAPVSAPAPSSSAAPTTYAQASTTSAAPASYSSSSSSSSANGQGLTYSPYKADGDCKSTEDVANDFAQLDGYSIVRLYGTDCNQVANVLAAAKPKGMKLFAGVYDIDSLPSELAIITSAVSGDWSSIDTIAIGNELVNSNTKTVPEVAAAVVLAKSLLSAAGFAGDVVTVDTFVAIIANPAMCEIGDYVAANCHAFFDGGVTASQAGEFVLGQTQRVSSACSGKKTVITESGWPSQGDANKLAVPSEANQQAAISSLKSSFSNNIFLFNAYNDLWKKDNSATFGAEKYWGMYGNSAAN